MDQLTQNVWLGEAGEAPAMIRAGVTTLLDLRAETRPPEYPISVEHFPLQDLVTGQRTMLAAAAERVQALVGQGQIVGIYCQAGVSRTAAVAILYLVLEGQTLSAAEAYVRERRPQSLPAIGLMQTIQEVVRHWQGLSHVMIRVDDLDIHAIHYSGPGPSIVLLHGVYGSWTHWDRVLAPLASAADVWALDLPGYGDSDDWPGDFAYDQYLDVIARAVRTVAPTLDMLGGYSFGAFIAAALLAREPDVARSALLVSLTGRTGDPTQFWRVEERRFPPNPSFDDRLDVVRDNLGAIHLHDRKAIDDESVYLTYHNIFRARLGHRRMQMGHGPRGSPLDLLRRMSMPALMIWGAHDPYCQPTVTAWADACHEVYPQAIQVIFPDASHWCQHEEPKRFITAVETFAHQMGVTQHTPLSRG